jgi:membrane-associated protease RseP (regulator of RpoE activity)
MRKIGPRWTWLAGAGALLIAAVALTATTRTARAAGDGTPWLGVYTQDLSAGLREGLDYRGEGVLVNRVLDGSPADKAGIQKGDVIARFNSRQVNDSDDLRTLVSSARVGQSVAVQVVRDGSRRTFNVRLEDRSAGDDVRRTWSNRNGDDSDDDNGDDDSGDTFSFKVPRIEVDRLHGDDDDEAPQIYRFKSKGSPERRIVIDPKDFAPQLQQLEVLGLGRGRLGVQVQDLNEGLSDYFDTKQGALVTDVVGDSPAQKAGIKAGDVITRFNGDDIEDSGDLIRAVQSADAGAVEVTVVRKGRTMTLKPEIAASKHRWIYRDDGQGNRDRSDWSNRVRENVDRARERADRTRELADRTRERADRLRDRSTQDSRQELRREMDRLRDQLRDLQRKLDELSQDED